jgi:hypothetical protein
VKFTTVTIISHIIVFIISITGFIMVGVAGGWWVAAGVFIFLTGNNLAINLGKRKG